jgi:hypothetical protein
MQQTSGAPNGKRVMSAAAKVSLCRMTKRRTAEVSGPDPATHNMTSSRSAFVDGLMTIT